VKNLYMYYCIFDHHKNYIMRVCFAFVISFLTALTLSCSAQQPISEFKLDPTHSLLFLNKTEAANTIIQDATDGFFEKITASEISIQIKRPLNGNETAENMKNEYLTFLQNDVSNFTEEEIIFVNNIFEEVFSTVQKVDKNIFPAELKLIKTDAKHYGESVYYTRENCIVIPFNELDKKNRKDFLATMLHELFHIYSRLNPEKSKILYQLIGFEPIGFDNLKLPKELGKRVFFNPDGVDFAQKITLKTETGTIYAIPIIYSNHVGFTNSKPDFFGYLEFNLFQITPTEAGKWTVLTQEDGFTSTLNIKKMTDFFRQIKDNTHYIIHPDEVLADNFSYVFLQKNDASVGEKFSKDGKQLMLDIETILKGGNPTASNNGIPVNGSNRR
jgi:hypothetical protein